MGDKVFWKARNQVVNGEKFGRVYHVVDPSQKDVDANREYLGGLFESKEAAQEAADEMNRKGVDDE